MVRLLFLLVLIVSVLADCTNDVCCDPLCPSCDLCTGDPGNDDLCCQVTILSNGVPCNTEQSNPPCVIVPTPSLTPSPTPSPTPDPTSTKTSSAMPSSTASSMPSSSSTRTSSSIPLPTPDPTPTKTLTRTSVIISTQSSSRTRTPSITPTRVGASGSPNPSSSPTMSSSSSPTVSASRSRTPSKSPTPSMSVVVQNYTLIREQCCDNGTLIATDYCFDETIEVADQICDNVNDTCCEHLDLDLVVIKNTTYCQSINITCPTTQEVCCNGAMPYNNSYCGQFYYLACVDLSEVCCNYTDLIHNEYCDRFNNFTCKNVTEICCVSKNDKDLNQDSDKHSKRQNEKKLKIDFCRQFKNLTCFTRKSPKVIVFLFDTMTTNYYVLGATMAVILALIGLCGYSCCCFGRKGPPQDYNKLIGKVGKDK